MQKSVLAEIVQSLDRKEIREIRKWLNSPAHNQREDVIRLFEYLVKVFAKLEKFPEKEAIWTEIMPGIPYDDAFMRQVMYFLLKSIEEYLVFSDEISNQISFQVKISRIYRVRKLDKAYKQASRIGREALQNQPLRNTFYLLNKFFLEKEEYEFKMGINQNTTVNLQEMAEALEHWFIVEELQVANSMLAHHKIFQKAHYSQSLLDDVLKYSKAQDLFQETAIAIYYYAYMTITNPAEEHYFDQFENLILQESEQLFTIPEIRDLYRTALNYCTAKVNQGSIEYCRRALEFYNKGVEKGVLLENNMLTRYTFGNAVAFAIKIKEYEWAENFIQNYEHHLDGKEQNSIINFNLSRVYFEKGDYKKAQTLLSQFEYDDMLFNIIAKTMLLKIYYETDEYDAFESLVDSMRIYLQRKEALDAARKNSFKNMLSLMKKLLHLDVYSKAQKEKYRELVVSTNPLAERDWLLKQVEKR
jgi:hypothetical protein